ncbi:MAG: NERD domain-containing protein [Actinobacteria bacterium]|nr:NERD domain-containing protein [Actinomycetota bacterium]
MALSEDRARASKPPVEARSNVRVSSLGDGRPGASAQQLHKSLRKDWLRRNRRLFGILAGILILIATAANAAFFLLGQPWMGGFFSGAVLTFWVLARASPPGWIENWQLGAWGEQKTAKELSHLPDSWVVLHDVKTGRGGNIDHLAIGPGGVFVFDSKRWSGTVEVRGDEVRIVRWKGGPSNPWTGASHVAALARETHSRVLSKTRIRQRVHPVVVIWGDFPQGSAGDRCRFVAGEQLVHWLAEQPLEIADHRVHQIAIAVRSAWDLG